MYEQYLYMALKLFVVCYMKKLAVQYLAGKKQMFQARYSSLFGFKTSDYLFL